MNNRLSYKGCPQKMFLHFSITGIVLCLCIAFVGWQSWQCFEKYLEYPQGTKLSVESTTKNLFPTITVCTDPTFQSGQVPYKAEVLSECGIKIPRQYMTKGRWSGFGPENCTNPELLFENAVATPNDLISYFNYAYFDNGKDTMITFTAKEHSHLWSTNDLLDYGRCYSSHPSTEMLERGIKEVSILLFTQARVFFHTPGVLATDWQPNYIDITISKSFEIDLEHEVYDMLEFGGKQCVHDANYRKDLCTYQLLFMQSMDTVGCTTPFMPMKSYICTDAQNGSIALDLYKNTFEKHQRNVCNHPCSYVTTRAIKTKDSLQPYVDKRRTSFMKISTRENIKVIKGQYLYSVLSLVAEIGGYVGLFLGVSILQVTKLVDLLLLKRCEGVITAKK